jgi:hypothetical protein
LKRRPTEVKTLDEIILAGELEPGFYYVIVDIEDEETRKKLNAVPNVRALRGGEVNLAEKEVLLKFQVLATTSLNDLPIGWREKWGPIPDIEKHDAMKDGIWETPGKTFGEFVDELELPDIGKIADKAISNVVKPFAIGLGILLGLAILSKFRK